MLGLFAVLLFFFVDFFGDFFSDADLYRPRFIRLRGLPQ